MRRAVVVWGCFVVLAAFIYMPSFRSPFLVDDHASISYQGKYYKQGPLALMDHFWLKAKTSSLAARPVTIFTLWIDYLIGGIKPLAYKLTNIFLHAFASFLVFILLRYLFQYHGLPGSNFIIWAGSLMFLFHPIHTQAVNIVIQRSVILMAIFGLLAFYTYLRFFYEGKRYLWVVSVLCLALSILSKASGVAFIFIIIFYVVIYGKKDQRGKYLLGLCVPLLMVGGFLIYLYQNKFHPQYSNLNPIQYFIVESRAIWIYWKLFIFPYPLQFLYNFPTDVSILRHFTWLALIAHAAVVVAAAGLLRSKAYRLLGFSIICAYLSIAPESSFFPMTTAVMEYRTYVAFVFLSLCVSLLLADQWLKQRVLCISLSVIVLIVFAGATFFRNTQINTVEKWHYDMVKSFQEWDSMNLYALDLLIQAKDMERVSKLLTVLEKKKPEVKSYAFLKKLMINGPKQSLEDNIVMIEANTSALKLPEESLTPFFLNIVKGIVDQRYAFDQKDTVYQHVFFNYLFYFRYSKFQMYDLRRFYEGALARLYKVYQMKDMLTAREELEKEKIIAAIIILNMPRHMSQEQVLQKIYEKHPNWQIFFDRNYFK